MIYTEYWKQKPFFKPVDSLRIPGIKASTISLFKRILKKMEEEKPLSKSFILQNTMIKQSYNVPYGTSPNPTITRKSPILIPRLVGIPNRIKLGLLILNGQEFLIIQIKTHNPK